MRVKLEYLGLLHTGKRANIKLESAEAHCGIQIPVKIALDLLPAAEAAKLRADLKEIGRLVKA